MNVTLRLKSTPTLRLRYQAGLTGPAGTISVGTVTTGAAGSSATITNSGTTQAAVLNFTIPRGDQGDQGDQGDKGWTPELAVVSDGTRRVQQVVDWFGGEGTKPTTGQYVGATGLETLIANGVDIRGTAGAAVIADGDKGDITTSDSGDTWTIDSGAVTLAKMADLATNRIIGRVTGSTGVPEALTPADVRTVAGANVSLASVATTSGTTVNLSTSIPTGVKRIEVTLYGVSTTGTSSIYVQMSVGGTFINSGYIGTAVLLVSAANPTIENLSSVFVVGTGLSASTVVSGLLIFVKDGSTNTWTLNGNIASAAAVINSSGVVPLAGAVDGIRLSTNGSDTFDAGTASLRYSFD